jgi:hypothetical protein
LQTSLTLHGPVNLRTMRLGLDIANGACKRPTNLPFSTKILQTEAACAMLFA